ncbi:MAG: cell wall hydrolase [Opitutales bacterium]
MAFVAHAYVAEAAAMSAYERQIVAAVLVLEAADQGVDGMRAVLHVIDNRAGGDPARAIGQVARRKAFSCLNEITRQAHPDYGPALRRAMRDRMWPVAMAMVQDYSEQGMGPDITDGATHYCIHPPPSWREQFTFVAQIGDHRFFR